MTNATKHTSKPLAIPWKICGLVLVVGLLFLGLVGLVLPLLPGLVFLVLALWILSKISTRFAAVLDDSPALSRHMGFMRRTRGLSLTQRLRLSVLVMAKMTVRGIESGISFIKRGLRPAR